MSTHNVANYRLLLVCILCSHLISTGIADVLSARDYCSPEFRQFLYELAQRRIPQISQAYRNWEIDGWLQLIPLLRSDQCGTAGFQDSLNAWRQAYPEHAASRWYPSLFGAAASSTKRLTVALLLPLQGQFSNQAKQILAGARQAAGDDIHLIIYDTNRLSLPTIQQKLGDDGIDCVLGPLTRDRLHAFAELPFQKPVLALNAVAESVDLPPLFFQITLAPENEAIELVRVLIEDDHQIGALFASPQSVWAERVKHALLAEFEKEGGTWVGAYLFETDLGQHRAILEQALGITDSLARHQRLQQILKKPLDFEPRRRQDIDFVVLIGQQTDLKMAYPLLRFLNADDLPTYLMGQDIALGTRSLEFDLDGATVLAPAWIQPTASSQTERYRQALRQLGIAALEITRESDCLLPEQLFMQRAKAHDYWRLDLDSGRFNYRNRAANIQQNRLRFKETSDLAD